MVFEEHPCSLKFCMCIHSQVLFQIKIHTILLENNLKIVQQLQLQSLSGRTFQASGEFSERTLCMCEEKGTENISQNKQVYQDQTKVLVNVLLK